MYLLINKVRVELPHPLPIVLLPPKHMLVNVELIYEQGLTHPVDHEAQWAVLGKWDSQQALYVL